MYSTPLDGHITVDNLISALISCLPFHSVLHVRSCYQSRPSQVLEMLILAPSHHRKIPGEWLERTLAAVTLESDQNWRREGMHR